MTIREFWDSAPEAGGWSFTEQIKLFAWYLHIHGKHAAFSPAEMSACFRELQLQAPANMSRMMVALTERSPKQLVRVASGFQLEARLMREFGETYGVREQTVKVHALLADLIAKMPNAQSRSYLAEAITCLRHGAFRAAVVMSWNVTFDHLCGWIASDPGRLGVFNAQAQSQFQKRPYPIVTGRADFTEYKESDVIAVARISGLLNGNLLKILNDKLDKRNQAAHPSGVVVDQLIAEATISELINNVVLVLK